MSELQPAIVERFLSGRLKNALEDTRIVLLQGARQVGKSTLANQVAAERSGVAVTLDDEAVRRYAIDDPAGFVNQAPDRLLVVDEVQRAPGLVLALKAAVDRDQRAGRYLVTGSADLLHIGATHESLAGRVETLVLQPFSQGEMAGRPERFIDRLFAPELEPLLTHRGSLDRGGYMELAVAGGYPEAVSRRSVARRQDWYREYIGQIVHRDAADVSGLRMLGELPRLLRMIAARSGSHMVWQALASEAGIARRTLAPYVGLLETLYLVHVVPAWSPGLSGEATKAPKLFLTDSGLMMATLGLGLDATSPLSARNVAGPLMETFVCDELRRQAGWADVRVTIHHYRPKGGAEVDLVLETPDGRVAALEIKAAETVHSRDLRGLTHLRDGIGGRFVVGAVLYTGQTASQIGDRLLALPIDALWRP